MAKPNFIDLPGCDPIPIIYEDRAVLAIDKPRGWMLVPDSWRKTNWNLQTAIDSSIRADDFWARSRNLTYLRHVHRLEQRAVRPLRERGGARRRRDSPAPPAEDPYGSEPRPHTLSSEDAGCGPRATRHGGGWPGFPPLSLRPTPGRAGRGETVGDAW